MDRKLYSHNQHAFTEYLCHSLNIVLGLKIIEVNTNKSPCPWLHGAYALLGNTDIKNGRQQSVGRTGKEKPPELRNHGLHGGGLRELRFLVLASGSKKVLFTAMGNMGETGLRKDRVLLQTLVLGRCLTGRQISSWSSRVRRRLQRALQSLM